MARKSNPGLPIETLLNQITGHLDGSSTALVERFAGATAERARRSESARARLAEHLGDDHPRVVRLQRRADLAGAVTARLEASRRRVEETEPLRPHEWQAYGRVVRDDGSPLPGMRVRVYNRDERGDDLLGDEITDESGAFRAIYHQRDFQDETQGKSKDPAQQSADAGEAVPQLYVTVADSSGKGVFMTDEPVTASPSRSDRFEIVLSGDRLSAGVPRTQCTATTAKGTQCRNLAAPGGTLCSRHANSG